MDFYALSLLMMIPAGGFIIVLIVAYLIYNRIQEKNKEEFEKRDY